MFFLRHLNFCTQEHFSSVTVMWVLAKPQTQMFGEFSTVPVKQSPLHSRKQALRYWTIINQMFPSWIWLRGQGSEWTPMSLISPQRLLRSLSTSIDGDNVCSTLAVTTEENHSSSPVEPPQHSKSEACDSEIKSHCFSFWGEEAVIKHHRLLTQFQV